MPVAPLDPARTLTGLLRDIGVTLSPLGFRGSGGVWRLVTPWGVAVVERQGSRASSAREKLFYVDTAVVPQVWWDWTHRTVAAPIEQARESSGLRLLEGRVTATDLTHASGGAWRVDATTDKQVGHWQAIVVLLADAGPSTLLDDACAGVRSAFASRPAAADAVEELIAWAHARAAR